MKTAKPLPSKITRAIKSPNKRKEENTAPKIGVVEVAGSSPVTPTIYKSFKRYCQWICQ